MKQHWAWTGPNTKRTGILQNVQFSGMKYIMNIKAIKFDTMLG